MLPISDAQLENAAVLIGAETFDDEVVESGVVAIVQDPLLARRLIDWLPEIFGMVLISHMGKVTLPTTFSAKNKRGEWVDFDFSVEPIFQPAIRLATHMFHHGPRGTFRNIASRSASVATVNRALNAGHSLNAGKLAGPAFMGIPAETYLVPS